MAYDAPLIDEESLSEDAWLLLQMRREAYRRFARELEAASPRPIPDWVQLLLVRWSLEALR